MGIKSIIENRGPKSAAFICLYLSPFVGMLYLNKGKIALYYLAILLLTLPIDYILETSKIKNYETYSILISLFITIFGCTHAYRIASQKYTTPNTLSWYSKLSCLFSVLVIYLSIALYIINIPFRAFLYEPFHIPSGSMIPTFEVGDYILADKTAYGYSKHSLPFNAPLWTGKIFNTPIQRGDIVIFDLPKNPNTSYIKRVIGLPNDKIQIKNGFVYINNEKLEQIEIGTHQIQNNELTKTITLLTEQLPEGKIHRILNDTAPSPLDNTEIYTVPPHHYFMMGDNRDYSQDSRVLNIVGYVHEDFIIGKAKFLYYKGKTLSFAFENIENR